MAPSLLMPAVQQVATRRICVPERIYAPHDAEFIIRSCSSDYGELPVQLKNSKRLAPVFPAMGLVKGMGAPMRRGMDPDRLEGDFEYFYRSTFSRVVSVVLRITGNKSDAEDAAIVALAKAHYRWRRIGDEPWREAWVFKVAINEGIRRLPKPLPQPQPVPEPDSSEDLALRMTLVAALQSLPQRQREAIHSDVVAVSRLAP